jgi:rhodanese-related sulfurtransferase
MDKKPINDTSEFTKTNWITFGVIATLLVVSPQTVAKAILNKDKSIVFVDVRSQFDFAKGHLPDAKNVYKVNLMKDNNIDFFATLKEGNKRAILYGSSASEANVPFMILKQMGIENVSYLAVAYDDLKAGNWKEIASNPTQFNDETAVVNFAQFISDANTSSGTQSKVSNQSESKPKVIVKPVKSAASKDQGC